VEYIAVYEPDEDGWSASVPDLPGCYSDGSTLSEVKDSIREAIRLWIETARTNNWPVPTPAAQIERIAV